MNNHWKAQTAARIATAIGVVAGVYFTESAWCVWAFLIPTMF